MPITKRPMSTLIERLRRYPDENGNEAADEIERLTALVIDAWQAGFARGHNDTVEGDFNPGWEDDPVAAQEWLADQTPPEDKP